MSFSTYAYPPPKFPNERYTYTPAAPPQALLPILPLSPARDVAPKLSLRSSSKEPAFTTRRNPDKNSGTPESKLALEGFELYKHSAPCAFPRSRPGSTRPAGKAREDVFGDVTGTASPSVSETRVEHSDNGDDNNKPKDTELDTKKARRKKAISQASARATKLRRESERLSLEDVRRGSLAGAERGDQDELIEDREPLHYLAVDRWVRKSTNTKTKTETKTKTTRAPGVTLVCLHANGFHKEMWIPTLQELLVLSSSRSEGSGTSKIGDARSSSSTGTATSTSTTDRDRDRYSSTAREQTEAEVEIEEILLVDIYNHAESYLLNDGRVGLVFDWQDVVSLRSPSFVSFLNARDMGETKDESPYTKFPLHSGLSCYALFELIYIIFR